MYAQHRVECASVKDFLARYYKPERYAGRGEDYAALLLKSYRGEFVLNDFVYISKHDSVTGKVVSYFRKD